MNKPKQEFQCPECGSKTGDEKVYNLKEIKELYTIFFYDKESSDFIAWITEREKKCQK